MWIYNKTNQEYNLKWGSKYYKLQPKMNEIESEIAAAFFGYNVEIQNRTDEKKAKEEAQRLADIIKQRWAISGINIKDDSWLDYNMPNSKWLISESHDELLEMLEPEPQKGKVANGNSK